MTKQVDKQLKLGRRKLHRAPIPRDSAREQVHLEIRAAQSAARQLGGRSQLGAHPCDELGEREGLHEVVDRPRIKAHHAILDLAARAQHDHRQARLLPAHRRHDLEAPTAREHQIEHDRIEATPQRQALAVDAVERHLDTEALRLKAPANKVDDPRLILDEQNGCPPAKGGRLSGLGNQRRPLPPLAIGDRLHLFRISVERRAQSPTAQFNEISNARVTGSLVESTTLVA